MGGAAIGIIGGIANILYAIILHADWRHTASRSYAGVKRWWGGEYRMFGMLDEEPTSFDGYQKFRVRVHGIFGVFFLALGIWGLVTALGL